VQGNWGHGKLQLWANDQVPGLGCTKAYVVYRVIMEA